jgi:aminopeptidase
VSGDCGPDPDAFARVLCDWCIEPAAGDQVLVSSTTLAEPLVLALHRALLEREAWPLLRLSPPGIATDFYRTAGERQLDAYAPVELAEVRSASAVIRIDAPANTRALAGIDPVLIARAARARAPVQEARLASRWCGTIWPTSALAQQAGMSDSDHAGFVARALFLDRPDPAAAWGELSARQAELVQHLSGAEEIHIEAEGTDLRLRVAGRTWVNSDGRRNMPSGEVFTGPHEESAEGTVRFTVPTSPRGVAVEGAELTFKHGEVVAARAQRGDDYLRAALATDPGARLLGELGIGTNPGIDRATGHILLDEKMAGTIHLALGRSYPETGGRNVSALHWDLICDLRQGGRVSADGQMLNDILWPVV